MAAGLRKLNLNESRLIIGRYCESHPNPEQREKNAIIIDPREFPGLIRISVVETRDFQTRLMIECDKRVAIDREEIWFEKLKRGQIKP